MSETNKFCIYVDFDVDGRGASEQHNLIENTNENSKIDTTDL